MPSVWVPDADGQWKETMAYMGFPGGKTKTIAVDLTRAFLTQDYRVRIKTTAEIYWDEVFFTVDEPAVEIRQLPLELGLCGTGLSRFLAAPADTRERTADVRCGGRQPVADVGRRCAVALRGTARSANC